MNKIKEYRWAKWLSLEVWSYLHYNNIWYKDKLPVRLWTQIRNLRGRCPLCELFLTYDSGTCIRCPIQPHCIEYDTNLKCTRENGTSNYFKWSHAVTPRDKAKYSLAIINEINRWEIK